MTSWLFLSVFLSLFQLSNGAAIRPTILHEGANDQAGDETLSIPQNGSPDVSVSDGDVLISKNQLARMKLTSQRSRSKRQLARYGNKWTNQEVFYYYNDDVGQEKRDFLRLAMDFISSQTCVKFTENSTVPSKVRIYNDGGCGSYIGMLTEEQGFQQLYFSDSCMIFGTGVHELLHVLGMGHVHIRYDRDDYVTVNTAEVGTDSNFIMGTYDEYYMPVPYEYGSSMHYSKDSTVVGSIKAKDTSYWLTLGNRRGGTFYDMKSINWHNDCKCEVELECAMGGYSNPANCSECICPSGYGGVLCDGFPENSTILEASEDWKSYSETFGTEGLVTTTFFYSYIIITAPIDKIIGVRIMNLTNIDCSNRCNRNGLEIKFMGDPRITNPVHCCSESLNHEYQSKLNPTPVILYQRSGQSTVTIEYRYRDTLKMDEMEESIGKSAWVKTTNGYDCFEYYL